MNKAAVAEQAKTANFLPPAQGMLQRKCSCGSHTVGGGECEECAKNKGGLQRKIAIGASNDPLEREAERVADQVMTAPTHSAVSGAPLNIQRYAEQATEGKDIAPASVERVLASSGRPLGPALQQDMEQRFGHDFSQVRVHSGTAAEQSARDVNANAYTSGHNIVFGAGQFAPGTHVGRRLIAHELTHVVQQSNVEGNSASRFPIATVRVQRSCVASPCPAAPVPIDALFPRYDAAEKCIQTMYAGSHPAKVGVSLSYNADWLHLTGGRSQEKKALACVRGEETPKAGPNFTAKSGMFAAAPDIWDFLSQTMYEITTPSGAAFRVNKLGAEITLANQICGSVDCGGLIFDRGTWAPPSGCFALGGDLYFTAINNQGVIVYNMLKDATKELVTAMLLALMANALKNTGPKAGAAAIGKVGGKLVPAYAIASMVAAVALLASGRAEAKPGPGEEPLVTLFEALEQKGTPIPPEIREMLDANPELKEKLNKAMAEGGDPTKAQEEINKQILDTIAANKDKFTPEELDVLLASTRVVGKALPKGDMTADELKKLAATAKAGGTGSASSDAGVDKTNDTPKASADSGSPTVGNKDNATQSPGTTSQTGMPPANPPDTQASKYKDLNDENKKKIKDASQSVSRLFQEFVSGQKGGVKLDDTAVKKFFEIVPVDLTEKQAEALISRLSSSQGMTVDAVLESLKKGMDEVKKNPKLANNGTGKTSNEQNQPAKSQEQIIVELKEMAKKSDFSEIPKGNYSIKNISEKIVDNKITAYVYGKTKGEGVGVVGYITGTVPNIDIKKLKDGDSFVMTITSQSPFVDKDGNVYKLEIGNTVTITK